MFFLGRLVEGFLEKYDRPRIAGELLSFISEDDHILDIGCGNGRVARILMEQKERVTVEGLEVKIRDMSCIKVTKYDGQNVPFTNNTFDGVMLIFVLHHCDWKIQEKLLDEASRVSRSWVIIMEALSEPTITGMLKIKLFGLIDLVTNIPLGIPAPLKFRSFENWNQMMEKNGLYLQRQKTDRILGVCKIMKYVHS